jgi:hypothetical protein
MSTFGPLLPIGGTSKDPTGWSAAKSAKVDVSDYGIPGLTGMQSLATIYQWINAIATSKTADKTPWANLRNILINSTKNYTTKEMASKNWIAKDGTALKGFLTGLANSNATLNKAAPLSLSQYAAQQSTALGTTGTTGSVPKVTSRVFTPAQQISDILNNEIVPSAKKLGTNLAPKDLLAIAQGIYKNGYSGQQNMIDNAILDKTNTATVLKVDDGKNPLGGTIGSTEDQIQKISADYGIVTPQDPKQLATFVKGIVGPGGDIQQYTDWARNQAIINFPAMKSTIEAGGTVKDGLSQITSNVATLLGISTNQVNYTDPKFQAVAFSTDPKTGLKVQNSVDQALQVVKTDPRFNYDSSVNGINEGSDIVRGMKSAMGL